MAVKARMNLILLWTAAALVMSIGNAEVVDQSNMSLTSVPSHFNSTITKLNLTHNRIAMNSSDVEALSKYHALTELDLSYNRIAWLPAGAFSNLTRLHTLSLRGNQLQTLPQAFNSTLERLDLRENPWNCSSELVALVMKMNKSVLIEGPGVFCASQIRQAGEDNPGVNNSSTSSPLNYTTSTSSPLNNTASTTSPLNYTTSTSSPLNNTASTTSPRLTTTNTITVATVTSKTTVKSTSGPSVTTGVTTAQSSTRVQLLASVSSKTSSKDSLSEDNKTGQQASVVVGNTWKFLTGVVIIALCTSLSIVCAVKSPSWYKLIFNYRHQRLRELDEPYVFSAGRFSNFSLDTEQTETSAQELDQNLETRSNEEEEEEDGFIEDRYIQLDDYKDHDDPEIV